MKPPTATTTPSPTPLLTTDLTGAKNWVDSGNAYETRPETVTLTLYRAIENGEPETVTGFTPVWENTETDTWTWKYSGMPKYDRQGNLYTYTVAEEPVPGYETAYGDNNAITNTLLTTLTDRRQDLGCVATLMRRARKL